MNSSHRSIGHTKPSLKNRGSHHGKRGVSLLARRWLGVESLERRVLLAADCLVADPLSESVSAEVAEFQPSLSASAATESMTARAFAVARDAGSTPASAHDLGHVEQQQLNGSLLFGDSIDLFKLTTRNPSELNVALEEIGSNVDLLLMDAQGTILATSRNRFSNDAITQSLDAGTYYVAAYRPQYFGAAYYSLELTVDAQPSVARPTDSLPENAPEETDSPSADDPTDDPGDTSPGDVTPFPDVPYYGSTLQSHLNVTGAPEAFAQGYSGAGVTVAIVDTGIDLDHPDLVGNLYVNPGEIPGNGRDDDQNGFVDDVQGYDFVDNDTRPDDNNGHGTHVAGIVAAANNASGTTGVAYDASIIPIRVLDNSGSGSTLDVAAGIRYAAELGADIINLSLGGSYSRAIQQAIQYAGELGSFVVAAAGNESSNVPGYPAVFSANYNHVLSVGAVTTNLVAAGFSNQVGNSQAVQIDAPGVSVVSTFPGGRYARMSGTSQAAPHVAGVAALTLQANPELSPSELRALLVTGATTQAQGSEAQGVLNAATTVAYAAAGATTVRSTTRTPSGAISSSTGSSVSSTSSALDAPQVMAVHPESLTNNQPLADETGEMVEATDQALVALAVEATAGEEHTNTTAAALPTLLHRDNLFAQDNSLDPLFPDVSQDLQPSTGS